MKIKRVFLYQVGFWEYRVCDQVISFIWMSVYFDGGNYQNIFGLRLKVY